MKSSTIAAISTAQGAGGIGVIRVSGNDAIEISQKIFKSQNNKKLADMKGYTATFGHIYSNGQLIDEAVVTVFKSPHSYTGEDVVEISCHGGLYVTKQVLRAVLDSGADVAQAGEFTKRAFLNGKIDLTEAESVMDIIGAKSSASARAALCVKDGALRKRIDCVKNSLLTQAAHLSAWADYPEEDISEVTEEELNESFVNCLNELDNLLKTYDRGQAVKEGIDTVIAGRPNVGKSTLMNLLSGCERSIVTEIPGTTRDIIEETVILGDVILRLSDTAGIHSTQDIVEKIGVDKAKSRLLNCGLVLAVFDNSSELNDDDISLINTIKDVPSIAIINKSDLESKLNIEYIKNNIHYVIFISAKNGTGLDELINAVAEITDTITFDPSLGIIANERQRDAVKNAYSELSQAKEALDIGMTFDAVTVNLENAIEQLLELTGERTSDEVVERVFHNFCVGK